MTPDAFLERYWPDYHRLGWVRWDADAGVIVIHPLASLRLGIYARRV